jgi:predicted DNA-binding WGR domain protein
VPASNKFWEITLSGTSFTTTYGKIGTTGQTTLKEFKSAADAKKEHDKLIAEKGGRVFSREPASPRPGPGPRVGSWRTQHRSGGTTTSRYARVARRKITTFTPKCCR